MYYTLEQGNQKQLILAPSKTKEWIELTQKNYSWEKYDQDDNRLDEYMEFLFDELPTLGGASEDDEEFWNQLTRGQKMFYSYLVFEGAIEIGGIFQFIWERPDHIYSFEEVLSVLKIQPLLDDYSTFVDRYEEVAEELEELYNCINYNNKKWEQQYEDAYGKGLSVYGEEFELGEYYYDIKFRKQMHKAMCDYIENNLDEFIKLENEY